MTGPAQVNVQLYEQLVAAGWGEESLRRVHAAYELMQSLVTGRRHGAGKPFVCHLVGTASVVAADGAPPDLVVAALCHAAYSHGDFGVGRRGRPTPGSRRELARSVGAPVECLVHRYWSHRFTPSLVAEWTARARQGRLDDDERCVVFLRVANDIDNRAFRSHHYRGRPDPLESGDAVVSLGEAAGYPALAERLAGVLRDERSGVAPASLGPTSLFAPPRSWRIRSTARARVALASRYRAVRSRLVG